MVKKSLAPNAAAYSFVRKLPANTAAHFLKKYEAKAKYFSRRSVKQVLLLGSILTILFVLGLVILWQWALSPPPSVSSPKYFSISPGESASHITDQLQQNGHIRSSLAARIYLRLRGLDSRIKPGGYPLSAGLDTPQVMQVLTSGPKDIWGTLPEGWRREQIAARLADTFSDIDPGHFLEATATLEGQLFPDTYLFPQGLTSSTAISLLTANFAKKSGLNPLGLYSISINSQAPTLSSSEVIILASLLEREAAGITDLPVIAGILLKRLQANWPLQVDASVQYARDTTTCRSSPFSCRYWDPLTDTDLASAYNTYLHPGLPPGPIANPGLAAIEATLHPTTSPYWFYLHAPDGTVHYGATLSEHQSNIDKYLTP